MRVVPAGQVEQLFRLVHVADITSRDYQLDLLLELLDIDTEVSHKVNNCQ